MMNLFKKRNRLVKRLVQYPDFARGSITSVCSTCNRARCICQKTSSRRAYRLTYKDSQQKTRIVYVRRDQLPKIQKMVANYTRMRKLIEQIIEINIEIFKKETKR